MPDDRASCAGLGAGDVAPSGVLRVHERDHVAVALGDLPAGAFVQVGGIELVLRDDVPKGHKIALYDIAAGAEVLKFGFVIGKASRDILAGEHVHSHNLVTALTGVEAYHYEPAGAPSAESKNPSSGTFMGYRRSDGRVGIRNEIWILCTVGCVARTAEKLARQADTRFAGRVDGVHALTHPLGCSQLGDDLDHTRKLLAALAMHPNAGGVLIIGLGCENNQLSALLKDIDRPADRLKYFAAQMVEDEVEAGLEALEELVKVVELDRREPCGIEDLSIGVKCGGSDGFSGLTANPLVGRVADRVAFGGGQAIMTEIPEIFGAERLLMARAKDEHVFNGVVSVVNDFKQYFLDHNQPVFENPSPGNKAGGITTLEEKSLGAVQKGGTSPLNEVLRYGERAHEKGLSLLEAPGNDAVSSTALTAAGAVIVLFTTGRGTPLGFPAPTLKIASNTALAEKKPHWIDFDAGQALTKDLDSVTTDLMDLILRTASGQPACNERNDEREIAIWKNGVTL